MQGIVLGAGDGIIGPIVNCCSFEAMQGTDTRTEAGAVLVELEMTEPDVYFADMGGAVRSSGSLQR